MPDIPLHVREYKPRHGRRLGIMAMLLTKDCSVFQIGIPHRTTADIHMEKGTHRGKEAGVSMWEGMDAVCRDIWLPLAAAPVEEGRTDMPLSNMVPLLMVPALATP